MNKFIRLLVVVVWMVFLALPVMAEDGAGVWDQVGDVMSGKGQTYAGVEINNIPIPIVKIEPLTLKVWADAMVGELDEDVQRDIRGGVRLAIDWQKLFK